MLARGCVIAHLQAVPLQPYRRAGNGRSSSSRVPARVTPASSMELRGGMLLAMILDGMVQYLHAVDPLQHEHHAVVRTDLRTRFGLTLPSTLYRLR